MSLPSTAQTNIITHPGIFNITTLWQNQMEHHTTEFLIRLNDQSWASSTTEIRLRRAQLHLKMTSCILTAPTAHFVHFPPMHNLSFHILRHIKYYLFDFDNTLTTRDWEIVGFGTSIHKLFILKILNEHNENLRRQALRTFYNFYSFTRAPYTILVNAYQQIFPAFSRGHN